MRTCARPFSTWIRRSSPSPRSWPWDPNCTPAGLLHRRTLIGPGVGQLWFQRFGADEKRLEQGAGLGAQDHQGLGPRRGAALVNETINEVIEPLIYAEALELVDYHLAQGEEVYLVSSAPAEIVEPFAELLGITGAISSRATIDEQGKFTGEMEFFAQGENKAVAITRTRRSERDIDLAESSAYSDSETDMPMLEIVGHPYAVNADRVLARIAHDSQWPLLTFHATPYRAQSLEVAHAVLRECRRGRRRGRARRRSIPARR